MKEYYVSFETAKLLKEKGFDIPCDNFYDSSGKTPNESVYGEVNIETLDYNADPFVNFGFPKFKTFSAPTLWGTMKWLREKYKLNIIVSVDDLDWFYSIIDYTHKCDVKILNDLAGFNSYESACESAIKYCLEHLI